MHTLTRIRAAAYSIMLASAGTLPCRLRRMRRAMPRPAKKSSPIAPLPLDQAGKNKFGPSLAGVLGRKSGTEPGYNYPSAMKGLNATWDETNLDEYLQALASSSGARRWSISCRTRKTGRTLSPI
jgi:hypothetical protein